MFNKNLMFFMVFLLSISFFSCSDKSSNDSNPVGAIGSGNGSGGSDVTFTIGSSQGQQGGIIFTATPSVNVKITKVTVSLPGQQFNDVIQGDGTTVFNTNEAAQIEEYTGVASGQQWTFQFEGTLAADGKAFNVTSNYTVP